MLRAGVAQLVERNLAKVEVESSRLFARSIIPGGATRFPFWFEPPLAGWQSGHAADCKSVYAGSIPTPASSLLLWLRFRDDLSQRPLVPAAPERRSYGGVSR